MSKLAVFAFNLLVIALAVDHQPFEVMFEWNELRYHWPSETWYNAAMKAKEYLVANNSISGIKLWKDKMYLTIPRWKSGVPVTLAYTSAIPGNVTDPILHAYPNFDWQLLGDCTSFQNVPNLEIDPLGRMWVLDTGRTETLNVKPTAKCPPRLVILDIEKGGIPIRTYVFPNDVAPKDSAYLHDIVIDHEDGYTAFISDSGLVDPGIIVYSVRNNTSWKIRHDSMKWQREATNLKVSNTSIKLQTNVAGIALSPPGPDRKLYYSPLSSFRLYSISVSVLKDPTLMNSTLRINSLDVIDLGRKRSQTAGMVMTSEGMLYLGLLADNAIGVWNSSNPSVDTTLNTIIDQDNPLPPWPDTLAIDEEGRLWCVTNNYQDYYTGQIDTSQPNFRILRSDTAVKNYQYFENGTAPELDSVDRASRQINFALTTCLTIALIGSNF